MKGVVVSLFLGSVESNFCNKIRLVFLRSFAKEKLVNVCTSNTFFYLFRSIAIIRANTYVYEHFTRKSGYRKISRQKNLHSAFLIFLSRSTRVPANIEKRVIFVEYRWLVTDRSMEQFSWPTYATGNLGLSNAETS